MRVRQLLANMSGGMVTVPVSMTVPDFAAAVGRHRIGAAPVVDEDDVLVGIISERDVVRAFHRYGRALADKLVGDLMTREVVSCSADHTVADVLRLMTEHGVRHVPVVDGSELVGFIALGDLVETRLEQLELDNEALREMLLNYETIG